MSLLIVTFEMYNSGNATGPWNMNAQVITVAMEIIYTWH